MTRRAVALVLIAAFALLVPAVALAGVKRGYYIETKTSTYIITNNAVTSIKYFSFPCIVKGAPQGTNTITKGLKLSSSGAFSYKGKSTLQANGNTVISVSITGKYVNGRMKGRISYVGDDVTCSDRSYSAKYFGTKVQG